MNWNLSPYLLSCLRGSGQVLFQNNSLSGLLFLIAIFIASPNSGLNSLLGLMTATWLASLVRGHTDKYVQGLYGYNGLLMGAMSSCYFREHVFFITFITSSSALFFQLAVERYFTRLPLLTFPFVITSWVYFALIPGVTLTISPYLFFHHFSQVFLVGNVLSGLVILLGLVLNSRKAFLFALSAGIMTELMNRFLPYPVFGFSAVLTAIVLGTVYPQRYWKVFLAVVATIVLQNFLGGHLQPLTAPFILVVWVILSLGKT